VQLVRVGSVRQRRNRRVDEQERCLPRVLDVEPAAHETDAGADDVGSGDPEAVPLERESHLDLAVGEDLSDRLRSHPAWVIAPQTAPIDGDHEIRQRLPRQQIEVRPRSRPSHPTQAVSRGETHQDGIIGHLECVVGPANDRVL